MVLCGATPALADEALVPSEDRGVAPAMTLPALGGGQVELESLTGQVVVVSFWATWCAPCLQELPHLDALQRELGDEGLTVLAVSTDGPETRPEVASLVRERGWTMPVLLDEDGAATARLNPRGTNPFTVVIDRGGRVAWTHEGYAPGDEARLRALVLELLAEPVDDADEGGADALQVSATNTLVVEQHGDNANAFDNDDHYTAIVDRLNVATTAGGFALQGRLDTVVIMSEPAPELFDDDVRLERLTLRWDDASWSVVLGDFYRQLGRGIALSLRKLDEAAVDVTLRGAHVEHRGAHHAVSLFGGLTNPVNLDDVSRHVVEDVDDVIVGLSAAWRPDAGELGVHAVYLTPEEELLGDRRHTFTGGLRGELAGLVDWLAVYVEGDVQVREVLEQTELGAAAYLTTDVLLGPVSVLVEGLWLRAFEVRGSRNTALGRAFDYNQPPTLERIDQEISDQRDVAGGRVRVEGSVADVVMWANTALRIEDPEGPAPTTGVHGWVGVTHRYGNGGSRLTVSGGYRHERKLGQLFKDNLHAEVDWVQHLVDALVVHTQVYHETREQTDQRYHRGSTLVGLEWGNVGSVHGEVGYDTQNPEARNLFVAGIVTWHAQTWFDLQVLAGTRRGGLRCIAGVCREFPAFAGFQARIVSRW